MILPPPPSKKNKNKKGRGGGKIGKSFGQTLSQIPFFVFFDIFKTYLKNIYLNFAS
jgi:hypothetical protein